MKLEEMEGSDLPEYIGDLNGRFDTVQEVIAKATKELKCTEYELLVALIQHI